MAGRFESEAMAQDVIVHERFCEAARKTLYAVFADRTVGRDQTRISLQAMKDEIDGWLGTLREAGRDEADFGPPEKARHE